MEIQEIKEFIKKVGPDVKNGGRYDYNKLNNFESSLKHDVHNLTQKLMSNDDPEALVTISEAIGLLLKSHGVRNSQIRNIFGYVKNIEINIKKDTNKELSKKTILKLKLLSPKMAYAIGRKKDKRIKKALEILKIFFDRCIEEIEKDPTKEKFQRFVNFFEAILSYHKYYGGQN